MTSRDEGVGKPVRVHLWMALAFGLAFVLGFIGWLTTEPEKGVLDALYLTLGLFIFDGTVHGEISWVLSIARFAAPAVTSAAVLVVGIEVMRHQIALLRARRGRAHSVVLGDGPEVPLLAKRLQRRRGKGDGPVVCIGGLAPADVADLRRHKVIHLDGVDGMVLNRILGRAGKVFISAADDQAAADIMRHARQAVTTVPITMLLTDAHLADDWRQSDRDDDIICRPDLVASAVLREHPPYADDSLVPAPVVLGDGALASSLADRIADGWQVPADLLPVHCIGAPGGWGEALAASRQDQRRVWHEMEPVASLAPMTVGQILEQSGGETNPTRVYVAYDDDVVTLPMANALTRVLGDSVRVVAVIDGESDDYPMGSDVIAVSQTSLLCDPDVLLRDDVDELADELVSELGRWPVGSTSAFGVITRADGVAARLEDQPERAQRALHQVAGAAESVLAAVGISLTRTPGAQPRVFVLTPDELTAVAHALAGLVPEREPEVLAEQHHRLLLELAADLPALLRRVGLIPVRVSGADHFTQVEVMERARGLAGGGEWGAVPERDRAEAVAKVLRVPVELAAAGN